MSEVFLRAFNLKIMKINWFLAIIEQKFKISMTLNYLRHNQTCVVQKLKKNLPG